MGEGKRQGKERKIGAWVSFLEREMCSKMQLWLLNSMNMLKATELYSLSG